MIFALHSRFVLGWSLKTTDIHWAWKKRPLWGLIMSPIRSVEGNGQNHVGGKNKAHLRQFARWSTGSSQSLCQGFSSNVAMTPRMWHKQALKVKNGLRAYEFLTSARVFLCVHVLLLILLLACMWSFALPVRRRVEQQFGGLPVLKYCFSPGPTCGEIAEHQHHMRNTPWWQAEMHKSLMYD